MAQLRTVTSLWDEYKGWAFLFFLLYGGWTLRKFFGGIGDGLGSIIEGATVDIKQQAIDKADKQRCMAALPSLKKRGVTDTELATWRADAATLAAYFGTAPGVTAEDFIPENSKALNLLKTRYPRLLLSDNKPIHNMKGTDGKVHARTQVKETADSLKSPVNWKVLTPFYKDVTEGNDLVTDMRKYLGRVPDFKLVLSWII